MKQYFPKLILRMQYDADRLNAFVEIDENIAHVG